MSLPRAKSQPYESSDIEIPFPPQGEPSASSLVRPVDGAVLDTALEGVSPVHGLRADIELAYSGPFELPADGKKIPFSVTLIGAVVVSAACWGLVIAAIHAL